MIKPLKSMVLVEKFKPETSSRGGIVLPERAQPEQDCGKVKAVGEGHRLEDGSRAPMDVKVGDVVIVSPSQATEVESDGKEYWMVPEESILGIVI
jgi:chaperonin GroES